MFLVSVCISSCDISSVEGLDLVELIDLGEQSGLFDDSIFEFLVIGCCLLKASKPEIRLRSSSETTEFSDMGSDLRLGWDTSTSAVGGTPAKPSWSSRNASTSLREDSPDLTPGRQVSLPNGACIPLGLLGAKGSSSIGFQTAMDCRISS